MKYKSEAVRKKLGGGKIIKLQNELSLRSSQGSDPDNRHTSQERITWLPVGCTD